MEALEKALGDLAVAECSLAAGLVAQQLAAAPHSGPAGVVVTYLSESEENEKNEERDWGE